MGKMKLNYVKGFVVALLVLLAGMLMDALFLPLGRMLPPWPGNAILALILLLLILITGIIIRKHKGFHFISSSYAAVPALCLFTLLVILMGLIPQHNTEHADFLNQVKYSWSMYLAGILLLVILLFSTAKRMNRFGTGSIIFVLNHLGIVIILIAGGAGHTDHKQYSMTLQQGEPVWYAFDKSGNRYDLDFALEMQKFSLEYHNPLLKIASPDDKTLSLTEISQESEGKKIVYKQYSLIIEEFLTEASKLGDKYVPFESIASVSAVRINLIEGEDTLRKSVWAGTASEMFPEKVITTETGMKIRLNPPMPKQYTTYARLYTKNDSAKNIRISVNDPAIVNGWKMYQQSYDESKGKYSDISVISLVKDPWLPVMYFGIFLLLTGVTILFITGKPKQSRHE
ncbi:MAG: cytochrome c biogenesis protein ResB [Bacteroidales bacterium]